MKEPGDPTNEERAARIFPTMETYLDVLYGGSTGNIDETDIIDLLTDLMHWCKQHDEPFEEHLESAKGNFEAEVEEEREDANDNPGGPSEVSVPGIEL